MRWNINYRLPITDNEILISINNLENHEAPGVDKIVNKHLKSSIYIMLPLYVIHIFNIELDIEFIKPIYKQRGDPKRSENYRAISLLSCFFENYLLQF